MTAGDGGSSALFSHLSSNPPPPPLQLRAQQHELSAATAAWREEKEAQESRWQKGVREREGLAQALAEERQKREELERAGAQGGAQGGRVREEMEVRVQAVRCRGCRMSQGAGGSPSAGHVWQRQMERGGVGHLV